MGREDFGNSYTRLDSMAAGHRLLERRQVVGRRLVIHQCDARVR
jgi:hypothetical protein